MTDTAGAPPSTPASDSRRNPWVIVIVAAVLLCCFCIGICGLLFAFVPDILQELGFNVLSPNLIALP